MSHIVYCGTLVWEQAVARLGRTARRAIRTPGRIQKIDPGRGYYKVPFSSVVSVLKLGVLISRSSKVWEHEPLTGKLKFSEHARVDTFVEVPIIKYPLVV